MLFDLGKKTNTFQNRLHRNENLCTFLEITLAHTALKPRKSSWVADLNSSSCRSRLWAASSSPRSKLRGWMSVQDTQLLQTAHPWCLRWMSEVQGYGSDISVACPNAWSFQSQIYGSNRYVDNWITKYNFLFFNGQGPHIFFNSPSLTDKSNHTHRQ